MYHMILLDVLIGCKVFFGGYSEYEFEWRGYFKKTSLIFCFLLERSVVP